MMKRRLRKGSKKGVFGFLPGRRRDFRVGSDPRGGLVLESLENRLLLSAALEFDHFNIVPNSIEVGGMYEVQYEFHNTGDAANLVISFVDINFYHEDDPSDFESMGSFYLPQVQPGQSSGFQSVWVHTSTVAPMTLPYGPGEYVARAVVARVYSNGPFYDTVTFTQNDTSPPTAELLSMDHVVTEEWGEQYTTMVVKVSDAIEIYGSSSSKSLKIIGPDGSEIPSGSLSGEVISQSNDESEKVIEFRIDAPGYDWDPQDNGTYQVYLKAGSFEDNCDREIPETYLGSLTVDIETLPPTVELIDPPHNGHIPIEHFNYLMNRYLYFRYTSHNPDQYMLGYGDSEPEFTLTYDDGRELPHNGSGTYVYDSDELYRYRLTPTADNPILPGKVTVNFIAGSYYDSAYVENEASTQVFYIDAPATAPIADLIYPPPDGDIDTQELNQNGYIDVTYQRTKLSTINGDEIAFEGAGGEGVAVKGKPTLIGDDTYRYEIEGSFSAGPVEVTFVESSFTNESGEQNTAETESFISFPDIAPLYVNVSSDTFVWDAEKKQFQYTGSFGLGLKPPEGEPFTPIVDINGDIGFDGNVISLNGMVTMEIWGQQTTLFEGDFEFDVGSMVTSTLTDAAGELPNEFTVAGTEIKLTKIEFAIPEGKTVADTQLEIQGSIKLPDDMGGSEFSITDPHKLIISPTAGVSLSGGKFTLPDLEIFMFGGEIKMIAKDMSVEYIAEVTEPEPKLAALRFRGSVSLPYFYNATADFTGDDSYIEVTRLGDVDWYGTLSVEDVVIIPGQWEINKALLGMKKDDQDNYITECEAKITLPTGIAVGGKIHFINGDINFVELEADNINKPLGATGAFLQRIMGHVDHLSEYEEPPQPISFGGSVGLTAGPTITVPLPDWLGLGDKFEGVLVGLDLSADIDENHLTGHGYLEIISGLVQGNVNADLDWEHDTFSASADLDVLQGLITAETSLFISYSEAFETTDITAAGKGAVKIPKVIPLWGGVELGSANMKLQYLDDPTDKNDYVLGWGKILVSEYCNYYLTGGVKVGFDGSYSFVGGKEIVEFTSENASASKGLFNAAPATSTIVESAEYVVEPNTPWLLMGADWGNPSDTVTVEITDPQGHTYTEDDLDSLDDIFIVDAMSDTQGKAVYVHEPEAGTWSIQFMSAEALTDLTITGLTQAALPGIDITDVENDTWNQEATISFGADWSDNETVINFYYDTNDQDADGIQFAVDIVPAASGTIVWDTTAIPPGSYYVYAEIMDTTNAPVTVYWSEPVVIEGTPETIDVDFGDGLAKAVTYYDADGSLVSLKLTKGQGKIYFSGDAQVQSSKKGAEVTGTDIYPIAIELTDSSPTTSLSITAKGGSIDGAEIGNIYGDSLGKLTGKNIDLAGDIDLTGSLGAMTIDDIAEGSTITATAAAKGFVLKADQIGSDVEFDLTGTVKQFSATSFADGVLIADAIGKVKISQGEFGAAVQARLADISGIDATGDISGDLSAAGIIKKINSKAGSFTGSARAGGEISSLQALHLDGGILSAGDTIRKVNIKGDILDSYIMAGYDIGIDCAFDLPQSSGDDTLTGGDVLSVSAKGIFARSYVAAGTLPNAPLTNLLPGVGQDADDGGTIAKVKFGDVAYYDAEDYFGLYAATEIKPFKIGKELAQPQGYFIV